ncbi:MAG TPA: hypothetical protein VGX75_00260, partial [bacterium]|nr:hypothetical protein [bacterium]
MNASPEARELHRLLLPVVRRLAIAAAARWMARATAVAAAGLLVWALATAVVPIPFPLSRVLPWVAAAVVAGGVAAAR